MHEWEKERKNEGDGGDDEYRVSYVYIQNLNWFWQGHEQWEQLINMTAMFWLIYVESMTKRVKGKRMVIKF